MLLPWTGVMYFIRNVNPEIQDSTHTDRVKAVLVSQEQSFYQTQISRSLSDL